MYVVQRKKLCYPAALNVFVNITKLWHEFDAQIVMLANIFFRLN